MLVDFGHRAWRLASWVVVQTVPPSLLSAYGASQLAAATGCSFTEAASAIGSVLVICLTASVASA